MFNYRQAPFIRLLLPFIVGVVLTIQFQIFISFILQYLFYVIFLLIGLNSFGWVSKKYNLRWIYGVVLWVFLFFSGISYVNSIQSTHNSKLLTNEKVIAIANVIESPIEKKKSYQVKLKVLSYELENDWSNCSEQVVAYFQKDSTQETLEVGDQLILNGYFNDISNNGNPNEFDYRKFMASRFIYKQIYLESGSWKIVARNRGNWFLLQSDKLRNYCIQILRECGICGDEFAVVLAMMLGDKGFLDSELKQLYANSGAIHILAISGLHVGVVFILLSRLLFFLQRWKAGRIIRCLILISVLWVYAFVTGLSPSVTRAVLMFTCIIIGMSLKRKGSIYNTLAASAFLLILVNPFIIFNVGFQLSYMAVLSIIFFQPRIYALVKVKGWLVDKVWGLISLSFAAQIGTFPIALFYFHQFANYFLLTNILIIPLAGIIIYSGFSVLLFSFVPGLGHFFSLILDYSVKVLNEVISYISKLPYSVSSGIYINNVQLMIIYSFIFLIVVYILSKNKLYIKLAGGFVIFFLLACNFNIYNASSQKQFVVYNVRGHTAIACIVGRNSFFVGDSIIIRDEKKVNYYVMSHLKSLHIKRNKILKVNESSFKAGPLYKNENFIQFYDKKIYLLENDVFTDYYPTKKLDVDILVVSGNKNSKMIELFDFFNVEMIVLDSSVSFWLKQLYLKKCVEKNIFCYSVNDSGAFILELM